MSLCTKGTNPSHLFESYFCSAPQEAVRRQVQRRKYSYPTLQGVLWWLQQCSLPLCRCQVSVFTVALCSCMRALGDLQKIHDTESIDK